MIYLNNAATTKIAPEVLRAMLPYLENLYGNPSEQNCLGRIAKNAIEKARGQIAKAINAEPNQIFFTSGATESNNWVLNMFDPKAIYCSKYEHHSVINFTRCGDEGNIYPKQVGENEIESILSNRNSSDPYPCLLSWMTVNNETGKVFDIKKYCDIAHKYQTRFHTDATQAFGHYPIDVKKSDVDFLTLSGHKFHAPKGVGILYIKDPNLALPFHFGGKQEYGLRAGTENVASIVGMGKACEMFNYDYDKEKANNMKKRFFIDAFNNVENMMINSEISMIDCISTTINLSFRNIESESLMLLLDNDNISVGAGSACNSGSLSPSHVLKAMGVPDDYIYGTIRISFTSETTLDELLQVASMIKIDINKLRGYC